MQLPEHLRDSSGGTWSPAALMAGQSRVATVTFSEDEGTVANETELELSCATANVTIKYTIDGTLPSDVRGTTYSSAIVLETGTVTVTAVAFREGYQPSLLAQAVYTVSA